MKADKKPIIGFICFMLSCILVIGITIGLLGSVNKAAPADTTDNATSTPEEPPAEEPELEYGYKFKKIKGATCGFESICSYAYKSQKRTLNVNEAKITVSFGALNGDKYIEDCNVPEYNIYFADPDDDLYRDVYYSGLDHSIYTVKTVKEQIFSEKYKVTHVYDRDELYEYYEFAHTEEITIPKELFTKREGRIKLCINGKNVVNNSPYMENIFIGIIDLKYWLIGNNEVILLRG